MNNLKDFILGFKFALSYFTILPVSFKKDVDLSTKQILSWMLFSLPLIGFIIASISLAVYFLLFPSLDWFAALISAVLYMVLYGFIHTEAVIDVADAIYAKHSGKDAYKVIKDPTVGSMGVLYAFALMILKLAGIVYLLLNDYFLEFLAIVILSRTMILFTIYNFEFKSSFVSQLKASLKADKFYFSLAFFSFCILFLFGFKSFYLLLFTFIFTYFISKILFKKLGFLNGDTIGATLELLELVLIIFILLV